MICPNLSANTNRMTVLNLLFLQKIGSVICFLPVVGTVSGEAVSDLLGGEG